MNAWTLIAGCLCIAVAAFAVGFQVGFRSGVRGTFLGLCDVRRPESTRLLYLIEMRRAVSKAQHAEDA